VTIKPTPVHHGEMVSLYLDNNRPLPKWSEGRIFPRSGSASTFFSVFVLNKPRVEVSSVKTNDTFWWPAINGIVYSFRYEKDAETFINDIS
jgi:hypothetical protein